MYQTARDLFEAARDATADAYRCNRALSALDAGGGRMGGGLAGRAARGRADGDGAEGPALWQRSTRAKLEARAERDNILIDAASSLLYGTDGDGGGLASLAPPWWADAICYHYLSLMKWRDVGDLVGYHSRYVQECVRAAFEIMDANGMLNTLEGHGTAEG